jgi:hypothetical protein
MAADATWLSDFYSGAVDDRGRTLAEILAWPDSELERVHNFIQWLFPLRETSGANPSAPVLDDVTIERFRKSPELQNRLRESFLRMLRFYGLRLESTAQGPRVVDAQNFAERAREWVQAGNHNHLRISRILKSLRLLGLEDEAVAFFRWLEKAYQAEQQQSWPGIPENTFRYWQWAVE